MTPVACKRRPVSNHAYSTLHDVNIQKSLVDCIFRQKTFQEAPANSVERLSRVERAFPQNKDITQEHTQIIINSLAFAEAFEIHHPDPSTLNENVLSDKVAMFGSGRNKSAVQSRTTKRRLLENLSDKAGSESFLLRSEERRVGKECRS